MWRCLHYRRVWSGRRDKRMNYIVLDLEWNQSNTGMETEVEQLPFEIIEIGAIKLNDECVMIGEFSRLVKPKVYREMHHITSKLIHMQMEELEHGRPFVEVAESFLEWCGSEEYLFCTWGSSDLTELQRNMRFYELTPLSEVPIRYLDVQKLFSIAYEDRKSRRALEYAVDYLELEKDIPFHRAFSDAYYTAKVFAHMIRENCELLRNESYDVFHAPKRREDEAKAQFDTYAKFISREFADKTAAMADREVSSSKCYLCHRNLRKKIKWFTPNGRHYYCLAYCEKHGYLKGKIRMRKTDEGKYYVVKTTKLISDEAAEELKKRNERAKEQHRKHKHSN
ncbi:MAG: exonuclease domain-containing protein [Butyrivibrio sp.]|nr:exonuclease domain-containing protein [Butyrivibrio sp.]